MFLAGKDRGREFGAELLDETRRQIGVSYPGDDEYLGG